LVVTSSLLVAQGPVTHGRTEADIVFFHIAAIESNADNKLPTRNFCRQGIGLRRRLEPRIRRWLLAWVACKREQVGRAGQKKGGQQSGRWTSWRALRRYLPSRKIGSEGHLQNESQQTG
jgi:hypothetical protein